MVVARLVGGEFIGEYIHNISHGSLTAREHFFFHFPLSAAAANALTVCTEINLK